MDLYEKEVIGYVSSTRVYLERPAPKAKAFMEILRLLKVEKSRAWSRLIHEDTNGSVAL